VYSNTTNGARPSQVAILPAKAGQGLPPPAPPLPPVAAAPAPTGPANPPAGAPAVIAGLTNPPTQAPPANAGPTNPPNAPPNNPPAVPAANPNAPVVDPNAPADDPMAPVADLADGEVPDLPPSDYVNPANLTIGRPVQPTFPAVPFPGVPPNIGITTDAPGPRPTAPQVWAGSEDTVQQSVETYDDDDAEVASPGLTATAPPRLTPERQSSPPTRGAWRSLYEGLDGEMPDNPIYHDMLKLHRRPSEDDGDGAHRDQRRRMG